MSYEYIFKLIVIGESGTGKLSLVKQFTHNAFNDTHEITIGVDFDATIIDIKLHKDIYKIKSQIWDTAGQEVFRSITSNYYRNAAGILLVFDLSNRHSFEKLEYWLNQIKINASPGTTIFLIGNKDDILSRKVSIEEIRNFEKNTDIIYLETSAKCNIKVTETFYQINKQILNKVLVTNNLPGVLSGVKAESHIYIKEKEPIECCHIL